jgi:hypothetical protein
MTSELMTYQIIAAAASILAMVGIQGIGIAMYEVEQKRNQLETPYKGKVG